MPCSDVCVLASHEKRSFCPRASSSDPGSVLVLHPREIPGTRYLFCGQDCETIEKAAKTSFANSSLNCSNSQLTPYKMP